MLKYTNKLTSFCSSVLLDTSALQAEQRQTVAGILSNKRREAVNSKKRRNFEPGLNREKLKISPKFQMVSKTEIKWLIFILWGPIKQKILSIVALNMTKYTIVSLILVDFVPISKFQLYLTTFFALSHYLGHFWKYISWIIKGGPGPHLNWFGHWIEYLIFYKHKKRNIYAENSFRTENTVAQFLIFF